MPEYDWKNTETGEIATTDRYDVPPDDSGKWIRDYSGIGIGRVEGAGGSRAHRVNRQKD